MRETYGGKPKTMNSPRQVVFASLIGTAIEFFDFYIYATTAVLGLPKSLLAGVRSGICHAGFAGNVRDRVPRATDRLSAVREPANIQVDGTAVILDLDSHAVCLVAAGGDPL